MSVPAWNPLLRVLTFGVRLSLAGVFALAALGKFDPGGNMADNFHRWGLSTAALILTGLAELVGALLVVVRGYDRIAIPLLGLIMVGAALTHFRNFSELGWPVLPVALIVALVTVALLDHGRTKYPAEPTR
jgi:uncharacterized membrane protein YphA (DoxX/SURF4 family)